MDTMNYDLTHPVDEMLDSDIINDSDLSCSSDEEQEQEIPVEVTPPLPKPPKAAPKKKAKKEKTTVSNVKKTRTVRRPYKSMAQDKLVAKQAVAHGRFEVASKRLGVIAGQLQRFDYELATRTTMPPVSEMSEEVVEAATPGP